MAKAIFKVLFKVITAVLNVILSPINLLVANLFPSFSTMISNFNSLVSTYVGSGLAWFSNIIPPMTLSLIVLYLTILISFYTISFTVHGIVKIFHIIQKIKFW